MSEPITISGVRVQNKINTESYWRSHNFTPLNGELVFYIPDSSEGRIKFKVGDGIRSLAGLGYAGGVEDKIFNQLGIGSQLTIDENLTPGIYTISPQSTINFKKTQSRVLNTSETATIIHTNYTTKQFSGLFIIYTNGDNPKTETILYQGSSKSNDILFSPFAGGGGENSFDKAEFEEAIEELYFHLGELGDLLTDKIDEEVLKDPYSIEVPTAKAMAEYVQNAVANAASIQLITWDEDDDYNDLP